MPFLPILATLLALLIAWAPAVGADTIDRVLAVVNTNQLITLSDVTAARDLGLEAAVIDKDAPDPVRAVLSKLIDRELILAEVDRYAPPEPSPAAVDNEVQKVRARFASLDAFDAALARSGIDEAHLREILRQELRIAAYITQRFAPTDERRQTLINDWVAGLRRRGDIIDLYIPGQRVSPQR
jgi:parvulin-like peptidyl-prolyl isomerase